jgi:hypothetical protein
VLQERLEYLSIYYYLQNLFSGTTITVEDGFPDKILTLPTVSLETRVIDARNYELGNKERIQFSSWYIDVFAQTKTQRDEITHLIRHALESCIPVYDYSQGFPPTVIPQIGCLDVSTIRSDWIRVMPQLVDKMYYRTSTSFTASFTNI